MSEDKLAIVILAAGKGTRMKSETPKVLHNVSGKPMIDYVVQTAKELDAARIILVVGYKAEMIESHFSDDETLEYVLQEPQLGTGHAVLQTEKSLEDFPGDVLVLYGDVPFTSYKTLKKLLDTHHEKNAAATILTTIMLNPKRYGRVVRNPDFGVEEIVEDVDADPEQKKIKEINTGIICFRREELFQALKKIDADNNQGELYLTDTIKILKEKNLPVEAVIANDSNEVMGLDTKEKLKQAEEHFS